MQKLGVVPIIPGGKKGGREKENGRGGVEGEEERWGKREREGKKEGQRERGRRRGRERERKRDREREGRNGRIYFSSQFGGIFHYGREVTGTGS